MKRSILLILMLTACSHTVPPVVSTPQPKFSDGYPSHWWKPVPKEESASWEILPQEAGPNEVILSKRNELGLLSNFAATPFEYLGKSYASVEGFWQMMLYPEKTINGKSDPRASARGITWKFTREEVSRMTAFEAKKAGDLAEENMKTLGIDWVSFMGKKFSYRSKTPGVHYRLIREAMWEKVMQNSEVKKVLLLTGNLILKPDHHQEADAPPEWRYFQIYMEFRERLTAKS